jgi:hypothetical protein
VTTRPTFASSTCGLPPTKGSPPPAPLAIVNGIAILGLDPLNPSEPDFPDYPLGTSITSSSILAALDNFDYLASLQIDEGNSPVAFVYTGNAQDVSYLYAIYVPFFAGKWMLLNIVNNSGLTLAQLKADVKKASWIEAIVTPEDASSISGYGNGGGGNGGGNGSGLIEIPIPGGNSDTVIGYVVCGSIGGVPQGCIIIHAAPVQSD